MKRITRLTESDLTRIVKRVLNEKVTIDIYNLKNQTINLYKDKENKNFFKTVTIDQLEDSDGKSYVWYETRYPEGDLKVYCAEDGIQFSEDADVDDFSGTLYNKTFEDTVKKQICTTNTKGVTVPKADFALTQPQTQQMGGGTLAERDLTRIVKRIINEDLEFDVRDSDFGKDAPKPEKEKPKMDPQKREIYMTFLKDSLERIEGIEEEMENVSMAIDNFMDLYDDSNLFDIEDMLDDIYLNSRDSLEGDDELVNMYNDLNDRLGNINDVANQLSTVQYRYL